MITRKLIQPLRFVIQACFMASLILPLLPHSETIAGWLFWTAPVVGVFFCGWICPFGTAQDWLFYIARKLKLPYWQIPYKFQKYLQFSRYIWAGLIFFAGIHYAFLSARFYFNDNLFQNMLTWTSSITLAVFMFSSLFTQRPFCNYFCMKGAIDGLMSIVRPFSLKRDESRCIHCRLCTKNCPMNVQVEQTKFLRHPNCINCLKCVSICPKKCLAYKAVNLKLKSTHKTIVK